MDAILTIISYVGFMLMATFIVSIVVMTLGHIIRAILDRNEK